MASPRVKKDVAEERAAALLAGDAPSLSSPPLGAEGVLAGASSSDGQPAPAGRSNVAAASGSGEGPADDELVRRCQGGELTAFEPLVERYQDRIFNLVLRLSGRWEDAQDITQDVFLRALEHIGDFRQQAQVYTWLFRIAVNLAISRRRRQQRVKFLPLDGGGGRDNDEAEPMNEPANPNAEPPEAAASRDEQSRRVAQAVAELDEEFRSVLVLKDIEGMDYQQIGEVLEVPMGTVKSRLHRARCELKAKLRPIVEA